MFNLLKQINPAKDYHHYRWFFTSNNTLVVGGKSDNQNEIALKNFLHPKYTVLHTSKPGSPFMIIISDNPTKKEIEETAIFTACFSKQWKESKPSSKIGIDLFKGEQIYKAKEMKKGTFGIKGKKQTLKVKPELTLIIQKGKIRAVPRIDKKNKLIQTLAEIKPGKLSKEQAAEKIAKIIKDKFQLPVSKDEIMQAIPSDKLSVR